MDAAIQEALSKDRLVDITTTGRKTGEPRRIEIAFAYDGETLHLTGKPGRRGWHANLRANPRFVLHLKQSVQRDIPAVAHRIDDEAERRAYFTRLAQKWPIITDDIDKWVARSPLVRVELSAEGS